MYHDLKRQYYWIGMKNDIMAFIAKCLTFQKFKIEHQHLDRLLQPLVITVCKWDHITTDFVSGLLPTL